MKDTVLVLTNSQDGIHSDCVIEKLRIRKQKVFRLNVDEIPIGDVKIQLDASNKNFEFLLYSKTKTFSSKNIKTVWYRRPICSNFSIKDPVQQEYAKSELTNFLDGLLLGLKDVFWLNNPQKMEIARKKIFQLCIARKFGFLIPKTIATNEPKRATQFYKECNGEIVFKAIYRETMDYENKHLNIPTTKISENHLSRLDLVQRTPCLFQEFINKTYELRITVVGEYLFAAKISPKNVLKEIDWRHPELKEKLKYEPVKLTSGLTQQCFRLTKHLGLSFAAIDIVVDKHERHFFLEINPNPQWYWIEYLTEMPISDVIADLLSAKS